MSRPKVIECGACGHPDYHCPARGCNHAECECETFQQVTELELEMLERIYSGKTPWSNDRSARVASQTVARLERKGCLIDKVLAVDSERSKSPIPAAPSSSAPRPRPCRALSD